MITKLIPFLIYARMVVNVTDSKYGQEVIYDLRVDGATDPIGTLVKKTAISNMTMKLKCRSAEYNDNLVCYFHEPRVVISTINEFGESQVTNDVTDVKKENIDDEIFELRYGMNGIREIVISSPIKQHKLDMIRALASQLSLDVGKMSILEHDGTFEKEEQLMIGLCPTEYVISSRYVDDEIDDMKYNYEIDTWSYDIIKKGKIMEIQRTRDIDKCKYPVGYFFGSREIPINSPIKVVTKNKSSKSKITLGKRIFTSYTENTMIVNTNVINITTILAERITLRLEKIVPATGPLPTVRNPSIYNIFPTGRD